MSDRWLWVTGASFALALVLAPLGEAAAECDQLLATMDKPAVVTLAPAADFQSGAANPARRVIVEVSGFQPAPDGSAVQAVVKAQKPDGTEEEIGRFGIFPQTEFHASNPSETRKYGFAVSSGLASGGPVKLKVELVPLRGEGKGASLQVGGAEWEKTP